MSDWLKQDGITVSSEMDGRASLSRMACPDHHGEELIFTFDWSAEDAAALDNPEIQIVWREPFCDMLYAWQPLCCTDKTQRITWTGPLFTKTAISAPVMGYYNDRDNNVLTCAASELKKDLGWLFAIEEETGDLRCGFVIPLLPFGPVHHYTLRVLLIREPLPFHQALDQVRCWWEDTCDVHPAAVPEAAREPMYSTWYDFHQVLSDKELEEECRRGAEIGLRSIIVDDGWQTEDTGRGYGFCGDWEIAKSKFPDMKAHVARVHALGMKYLIWYTVPFIGIHAKNRARFEDKFLCMDGTNGVLDPRYPEVREFLKNTYLTALKEWDLDGFKLDFIDWFSVRGRAEQKPGMDFLCVQDALDFMMKDILATLRSVKPDILIEFRQAYIGPNMRQYGNMFRVGDCPNNFVKNRVGITDLRMLSGQSAVHSDMLMWHPEESPENCAIQMENVIFGVLQLSVRLDQQSPEQLELIRFWIDFMEKNRHILLDTPLIPENPQFLYPVLRAEDGRRTIIGRYATTASIALDASRFDDVTLVNATKQEETVLRFTEGEGRYDVELLDYRGRTVGHTHVEAKADGTALIRIPAAGLAVFHRG